MDIGFVRWYLNYYREQSTPGFRAIILFILVVKRVTDKLMPCGTPSS